MSATPAPRLFHFIAGTIGPWIVTGTQAISGATLPAAARITVSPEPPPAAALWSLRGITSHERYVTRAEKTTLVAQQEGLGRPLARCAALIPIRKNNAWWALTQDERREILEERSHHIAIGMQYLPAIARRLHHCRDLGPAEPFDFITWFEYAPADTAAFDDLLAALRATPEWEYVEREVDIRLTAA